MRIMYCIVIYAAMVCGTCLGQDVPTDMKLATFEPVVSQIEPEVKNKLDGSLATNEPINQIEPEVKNKLGGSLATNELINQLTARVLNSSTNYMSAVKIFVINGKAVQKADKTLQYQVILTVEVRDPEVAVDGETGKAVDVAYRKVDHGLRNFWLALILGSLIASGTLTVTMMIIVHIKKRAIAKSKINLSDKLCVI